MKRRQAVYSILLGLGIITVAGHYKWFSNVTLPELKKILSDNKLLIDELAETIIPTTDTPGAREAEVGDFITKVIINCCEVRRQHNFIQGLQDVRVFSNKNYDKVFEKCTMTEKTEILQHFEKSAYFSNSLLNQIRRKLIGDPFFSILKQLTVIGYCSSELGATKGLGYDYIPGRYEACIMLLPDQKSWATK